MPNSVFNLFISEAITGSCDRSSASTGGKACVVSCKVLSEIRSIVRPRDRSFHKCVEQS